MKQNYTLDMLEEINIDIKRPSLIFLYGDLWSGKTTLTQSLIKKLIDTDINITSPTYVYYNKYEDIYHFDLYRLSSYDEFVSIGGEEVLDNNQWVILVEWPQILEEHFVPDIKIYLEKTQNQWERTIEIEYISD